MGLEKNNTDLEEIRESILNLENTSQEIKTAVADVKTDVAGVKTDTEGITLSNESIEEIANSILAKIGATDESGGSATTGTLMSKINKLLSTQGQGIPVDWSNPIAVIQSINSTEASYTFTANKYYWVYGTPIADNARSSFNMDSSGGYYIFDKYTSGTIGGLEMPVNMLLKVKNTGNSAKINVTYGACLIWNA